MQTHTPESTRSTPRLRTQELTYMALMVVLLAVCAWITIPTAVPFTLQTFAMCMALCLLGGKRGTLAIAAYLLLGTAGLPVFSSFRGGIGALLGATGGYLAGFLLTGLLYWLLTHLLGERLWVMVLSLLLGLAACYAFGTIWFMAVYARTTGSIGLGTALGMCVLPFLLPDLCKLGLAVLASQRLRRFVNL